MMAVIKKSNGDSPSTNSQGLSKQPQMGVNPALIRCTLSVDNFYVKAIGVLELTKRLYIVISLSVTISLLSNSSLLLGGIFTCFGRQFVAVPQIERQIQSTVFKFEMVSREDLANIFSPFKFLLYLPSLPLQSGKFSLISTLVNIHICFKSFKLFGCF